MDTNTKNLIITGNAADDITRFRQRSNRRTKTQSLRGSETTAPAKNIIVKTQSTLNIQEPVKSIGTAAPAVAPAAAPVAPVAIIRGVVEAPRVTPQVAPQPTPQPTVSGGAKVILNPLKHPRIKLQPKHSTKHVTQADTQTRKARKIQLSVGNLTKRFTRAKKLKEETEEKTVLQIKDYLIKKGVIQQKSKAPEKMLRSMYSDFMLLNDQAL